MVGQHDFPTDPDSLKQQKITVGCVSRNKVKYSPWGDTGARNPGVWAGQAWRPPFAGITTWGFCPAGLLQPSSGCWLCYNAQWPLDHVQL